MRKNRSTLKEYQGKFENWVALTASKQTAARYAQALNVVFNKLGEREYPEDVLRFDVEDFKVLRLRDGVSARTVNYEVSVLRAFYNWRTLGNCRSNTLRLRWCSGLLASSRDCVRSQYGM